MFNMCGLLNKICVNCMLQLGGFRKEMQFVKEKFDDIMSGDIGQGGEFLQFAALWSALSAVRRVTKLLDAAHQTTRTHSRLAQSLNFDVTMVSAPNWAK